MNILSNTEFFDDVSHYYDKMVNFNEALKRKTDSLSKIIISEFKTAADIGCGSGIDSIALASNGLEVCGFDSSHQMIEKAKANAAKSNHKISFYNMPAKGIPNSFNSKFDFVCSLGNTIANIPHNDIENSFKRFAEIVKPKGLLLLHILNYEKIINANQRIININKDESNFIIRFYDFKKEFLNFNILRFKSENPKVRNLISTKVFPHTLELILNLLQKYSFKNIKIFQDIKKTPFHTETSNDIYLIAKMQ